MIKIISDLLLFTSFAFADSIPPTASPIFLKAGFSSILEFEETPTQVVLGDQNLFQIERLEKSIVIKPLVSDAATNMFVYFKTKPTKLFLLRASEDNEPTFFRKFESIKSPPSMAAEVSSKKFVRGIFNAKPKFDKKKDFLTIDFYIAADSSGKIAPNWEQIRLKYKERLILPSKLWSERKEAQRDSQIKVRLIFTKPNIPTNFEKVTLVIPLVGKVEPMTLNLRGNR